MVKKTDFDYGNPALLLGRTVIVGLNGGTNIQGEVRFMDDEAIVVVTEPKSTLDIETQVVHTVINLNRVDFIQFKTERVTSTVEKDKNGKTVVVNENGKVVARQG